MNDQDGINIEAFVGEKLLHVHHGVWERNGHDYFHARIMSEKKNGQIVRTQNGISLDITDGVEPIFELLDAIATYLGENHGIQVVIDREEQYA